MSEENSVVKPEKKKKKRSFWWLWLLLILVVFAGGVVVGLKLNTMPVPYEIVNRYFPQLAPAQNDTAEEAPEAEPAPSPVPTAEPEPVAEPAPAEEPKPEETEAPAAPEESAGPKEAAVEEEAEPEVPEEAAPVPETAEEPKESMKPVFGKKDEVEEPESKEEADAAPGQPIGIDRALNSALEHAGVRKINAEVTGVYKTVDIDTTVYAVEFTANGTAYEYFVNAVTGEIEGWRSSRVSADAAEEYYYPDTPDIEKELFPAINRAKKSR